MRRLPNKSVNIEGHRGISAGVQRVQKMITQLNTLYEKPAYGAVEAAIYLKVPVTTLRYWLTGFGKREPIIEPITAVPTRLSL